ncbi:alpha/beta hydrolase fold protein [Nadsonia fulvescens var. elongata DSM 6958]|uniref:Alpha/beta hydrolase fold protein n=1 Tax=Nadsonia fulvescens var. elongata DSM 6958 TaxID=857566 RepID=A0A1E3PSS4_9ASCO|nr:alpha/beta hydrolase fold protein [Nadsonia fulvescens var. elongata DSM 6958]
MLKAVRLATQAGSFSFLCTRSLFNNNVSHQIRTYQSYYQADSMSHDIPTVDLDFNLYRPPPGVETTGPPLLFLHGIFGNRLNTRGISRTLSHSLKREVYCVDLRNHGTSAHNPRHDYPAMANDIERFIEKKMDGQKVILVGYSMGAKVAMAVGLRRPELAEALVCVDNAPVDARLSSDFGMWIRAMKQINQVEITSMKQANEIMEKYDKRKHVQAYVLSNMIKDKKTKTYNFRIPVDILGKALDHVGDFPYDPQTQRYTGPTLIIRATESTFVADETLPVTGLFFPNFNLKDVKSDHWIIIENTEAFLLHLTEFVQGLAELDE